MLAILENFRKPRTVTCTVTFFMKSGNKVVVDKVVRGFSIIYSGNEVTKIGEWKQYPSAKNFLLLGALSLDQIEAITYT